MDKLRVFYDKLFPVNMMHRWLNYLAEDKNYFPRREFSMTVLTQSDDEAYFRWRSYSDADAWKRDLMKFTPIKLDIGAVYNASVAKKDQMQGAEGKFKPVEHELVFDIDMTDYDDIRSCCSGANICEKCWIFMTLALKVLNRSLKEDFGFRNILWVYSGRRGIHCWVVDPRARGMPADARASVADYMHLLTGGEQNAKRLNLNPQQGATASKVAVILHPVVEQAYQIIRSDFWEKILEQQNPFFPGSKHIELALNYFSGERKNLESLKHWMASISKFNSLQFFEQFESLSSSTESGRIGVKELVLAYSYPRLDINVSKGMNHLLKSPFCIHPKTGRVCVPIDAERPELFNPLKVPSLANLVVELEKGEGDVARTSLQPYLHHFREFVKSSELSIRMTRANAVQKMEQLTF
eukprot:GDKJ01047186.1.p1 GENE.GDKJ01047186.1~~GDKJ01047186.1.p1  ORF type:complete len:432 (+),score=82.39 GDKJ01047186.1:69-1298(+)